MLSSASMKTSAELATVATLLDQRAIAQGDLPFVIDAESGETISYRDARDRAAARADAIVARGIAPGDSVAYAMHNGSDCVLTILGILYGGFRAVAINLVAGVEAMGHALGHSESTLVIVDAETRPVIDGVLASDGFRMSAEGRGAPLVVDADALSVWPSVDVPDRQKRPVDTSGSDADALIMYTSGTTGRPKGVVLSHGNLLAGGRNVAIGHALEPADRALCVLPLFHINGLCVTLFGPMVSAGSVVMPLRFSATRFWDWIATYRCSWFSVVPTQVSYLLHAGLHAESARPPTPTLRFGRSASAPLAPDVHQVFEARFGVPLIETMGLTETAGQILSNPMPPAERRSGSPGRAVGTCVRIVDASAAECPVDVDGEILVAGSNVMQRYFRDERASAEALTDDGWLRTGDIGRKDSAAYFYVTGRLKELIIKGGENIAPREIDDALHAHPDVIEAAAFGSPCDRYGEKVEAAVALRLGSSANEATLLELCEKRLGTFKSPDRIYLMAELPKGPSGKIQRRKVAELCQSSGKRST